jgi:hypothetical protein
MSGEVEAAGAVIDAALVGRAVDHESGHKGGHGDGHHGATGPCANCGTPLAGHYCSNCGQPAHIHRSLGHMIEEIFHGVIHFDARAWRTLPKLVFNPGKLTYEYIHGRRATYISPLAMFLFVIFLMFFVFSLTGGAQTGIGSDGAQMSRTMGQLTEAQTRLADARAGLEGIEGEIAAANAAGATPEALAELEKRLADAQAEVEAISKAADELTEEFSELVQGQIPVQPPETPAGSETPAQEAAPAESAPPPAVTGEPPATAAADAEEEGSAYTYKGSGKGIFEQISEAAHNGEIKVNTGFKWLDKKLLKKLENPELAWYKIQNTAYKFSFLLIPISLPFLWLLFFWKRGVTLFDHCVFILYSLSFMSLLFMVISLLGMVPWNVPALVWTVLVLAPIPHMYLQLKGAYRLGIFSAVWRTFMLLIFSHIALVFFFLSIVAMGVTG